jgi:tocopherol O-methyltransferase
VDPEAENPRYLLCDWLENRLSSTAFDALVAIESSEHMTDLGAFFAEAFRVLRPGGRLAICAWLTRERLRAWENRWIIVPICREGRLRGMESASRYQQLACELGFITRDFQDVSRQVKQTWPICVWRVVRGLLRDPAHRRFLLRDGGPNRIFALTVPRIWLAYELGSMRYGILTFVKPEHEVGSGTEAARAQSAGATESR